MIKALLATVLAGGALFGAAWNIPSGQAASNEPSVRFDDKVVPGGDPAKGLALVAAGDYGCGACHAIPNVKGAQGIVGPRLEGFRQGKLIAGVLPNTPGNLIQFLQDPPSFVNEGAMPNLGLSETQARDIAAYLYQQGGGKP